MLKRQKLIIGSIVVVAIVGIGVTLYFMGGSRLPWKQEVSNDDPVDMVVDFYDSWLEAAQATTTDPYLEKVGQSPLLSKRLRERLSVSYGGIDPVLCQTVVPARISTRIVYETADGAQVLVTARKPATSTEQAIVTLKSLDGGLYIDDITCTPGEFAPEVEFTFDKVGQLVKKALETGGTPVWHLVFTEVDQPESSTPLIFGAQSMCTRDGSTSVCTLDTLTESARVHVQGNMTERGAEVKNMIYQ